MRTRNPITVLGPDGRPLAGASVMTRIRATNADAVVYSAEIGGGVAPNPAITDVRGRVTQWCERGAYASTVTAAGMSAYVEEWESSPGSNDGVDANWIDDDVATAGLVAVRQTDGTIGWAQAGTIGLADDSVTNAKMGPGAVGPTELLDAAVTQAKLAPTVADRIFGKAAVNAGFTGVYTLPGTTDSYYVDFVSKGGPILFTHSGGWMDNFSGIAQTAIVVYRLDAAGGGEWHSGTIPNNSSQVLVDFTIVLTGVAAGSHRLSFRVGNSDGSGTLRIRADGERQIHVTAVEL